MTMLLYTEATCTEAHAWPSMPELPELEVVCEALNRRLLGQTIAAAIVIRDVTGEGFGAALAGARLETIARWGKSFAFAPTPQPPCSPAP